MTKNQTAEKTADGRPQTAAEEAAGGRKQEAAETAAAPPPSFKCPSCKHTSGTKLGLPFQKGEQSFQYIKCGECNFITAEEV